MLALGLLHTPNLDRINIWENLEGEEEIETKGEVTSPWWNTLGSNLVMSSSPPTPFDFSNIALFGSTSSYS